MIKRKKVLIKIYKKKRKRLQTLLEQHITTNGTIYYKHNLFNKNP